MVLAAAGCIVVSASAHAQTGDAALAEALFREGKALMKEGRYNEACPKLAESNRIDAGTGTLLALAVCHEEEGKTATAWAEYNEVLSAAERQGQQDRGRVARARIAALEPRLSKLAVVVSTDASHLPGLRVTRDGVALGEPTWGSAIPVDPGDHVIEAMANRKKPFVRSVRVGSRADRQTLTVSELDDDEAPPKEASPTPGPSVSKDEGSGGVRNPPSEVGTRRPIPLSVVLLTGTGAAALGSFAYFGLTGRSEYFDFKGECGPSCSKSEVASTHTKLVIADVSLGVSLVALGVAAYLFFSRPHASDTAAVRSAAGSLGVGTVRLAF